MLKKLNYYQYLKMLSLDDTPNWIDGSICLFKLLLVPHAQFFLGVNPLTFYHSKMHIVLAFVWLKFNINFKREVSILLSS